MNWLTTNTSSYSCGLDHPPLRMQRMQVQHLLAQDGLTLWLDDLASQDLVCTPVIDNFDLSSFRRPQRVNHRILVESCLCSGTGMSIPQWRQDPQLFHLFCHPSMFQKTQEPLFGLRLILCKFTQVLVWFFRIPENTEDSVDVDFYLAHFRKTHCTKNRMCQACISLPRRSNSSSHFLQCRGKSPHQWLQGQVKVPSYKSNIEAPSSNDEGRRFHRISFVVAHNNMEYFQFRRGFTSPIFYIRCA